MIRPILLVPFGILLGTALLDAKDPLPLAKDTLPEKLAFAEVPLGLDVLPIPKENPLTEARVALGRKLFFDPILSGDNTVACASCHRPDKGFASGQALPRGIRGQLVSRRAPTLFNRAFSKALFWDGRSSTLEEQALQPIENPQEMGSSVPDVLKRLKANEDYCSQFNRVFEDGITSANLAKAVASFERVLLRGDSPVDRFRKKGEHDAFSTAERHGFWLYESKAQCWRCHAGANFTDEQFHNTGVSWGKEPLDLGRFQLTKKDTDKGKFKTPTLRGVSLTAPYMHNGSIQTLDEVVEFYNKGGKPNPHLDIAIEPLKLTQEEIRHLVAFLKSL